RRYDGGLCIRDGDGEVTGAPPRDLSEARCRVDAIFHRKYSTGNAILFAAEPRCATGGVPFHGRGSPYRLTARSTFLWFNDNAEDAAEFYLSVFPGAKKLGELRSSSVGPWPAGKIATITIELMGQPMPFLNGGSAHALTPAFSYSVACQDQAELDRYWDKLLEGGKPMACGWLTDKFGLCWQIVPEKIGEILK